MMCFKSPSVTITEPTPVPTAVPTATASTASSSGNIAYDQFLEAQKARGLSSTVRNTGGGAGLSTGSSQANTLLGQGM